MSIAPKLTPSYIFSPVPKHFVSHFLSLCTNTRSTPMKNFQHSRRPRSSQSSLNLWFCLCQKSERLPSRPVRVICRSNFSNTDFSAKGRRPSGTIEGCWRWRVVLVMWSIIFSLLLNDNNDQIEIKNITDALKLMHFPAPYRTFLYKYRTQIFPLCLPSVSDILYYI